MWLSLSAGARDLCREGGWLEIEQSPNWKGLDPIAAARTPGLLEEQRIELELIPLCEHLHEFAARFGLLFKQQPVIWAMQSVIETLDEMGKQRDATSRWRHPFNLPQEYPAPTELGWTNAATGLPEDELFTIVIEIPPKQPNESLKAFEKRFNKACREVRTRYLRYLRSADWKTRLPYQDFTWIDHLAKWQAGRSASEIVPSIKTPSHRAAFSRGIKAAGHYIGITPRLSKHDPKHRPRH